MEVANVVISHEFDPEIIQEIQDLREVRLKCAEKMLADLDWTSEQIKLKDSMKEHPEIDFDELRSELTQRIETLQERVESRGVIFADEIARYMELVKIEESYLNT